MSTPAISDKNSPYFQALVPGKTQRLDFTNSPADSLVFQSGTTLIQVFSTQDCWILLKESTSSSNAAAIANGASGDSYFCPGGVVNFFGTPFKKDVLYKVSVVRDATSGTAYITEAL